MHDFQISTPGADITGSIAYSDDGRTLTYVPDRGWPLNSTISITPSSSFYFDWTGANFSEVGPGPQLSSTASFTTAGVPASAAVTMDAVNPPLDAPDAPLNSQIQFRFADPVEATGLKATLSSDGQPVAVKLSALGDGRTFSVDVAGGLLGAGRRYTVTVDGARNADGVAQASPESWSFSTANLLLTGSRNASAVLAGGAVRVLLPRPLNAASLSPDSGSLVGTGNWPVAATTSFDPATNTLTITPVVPFAANADCGWGLGALRDWAGNAIVGSGNFSSCGAPLVNPSPHLSVLPPPGGVMSWDGTAAVFGDGPFTLRFGTAGIHITRNGVPVSTAAQIATYTPEITMRPSNDWFPGETYQVEVDGLVDSAGNDLAPLVWSFQISADTSRDTTPLRLLTSTPANSAVGVSPATSIALDFSKPVMPYDGGFNSVQASGSGGNLDLSSILRPAFQGSHVEYPSGRLPAGVRVNLQLGVKDQVSGRLNTSLTFTTAAAPDQSPPAVESISPPPGTRLAAGKNSFLVRFTEPVWFDGGVARFSMNGATNNPLSASYPAMGDGCTLVLSFSLPPQGSGTLDLLPGIVDMAGNPLAPVSFEYSTGPAADGQFFQIVSYTPSGGNNFPVDTPVVVTFNQPVAEAGLAPVVTAINDGVSVPVRLSGDSTGRIWTIAPQALWRANTPVAVTVNKGAYAISGAVLTVPFSLSFRTPAAPGQMSDANTIAAVESSPSTVDIRFAAPVERLPDEPFGIRSGQQRVGARLERIGESWLRLVPDTTLDPALRYYLMAGPGVEIPLRVSAADKESEPGEPVKVETDDAGVIRLRFDIRLHPFGPDPGAIRLLDGYGRTAGFELRMTIDGRTVILQPRHPGEGQRVSWRGKELPIRRMADQQ